MSDAAAPAEGAEEAPKKKISLALIMLGLQLVVLLGAGGVIVKVALAPKKVDMSEKTLKESAIASVRDDLEDLRFVEFEDFTANLLGQRILKTKIQVEVSNEEVAKVIERRKAAIRAQILNVLSAQTGNETEKIQGKLLLKDAIRDAMNEEISPLVKKGVVRDVYFVEFLMI